MDFSLFTFRFFTFARRELRQMIFYLGVKGVRGVIANKLARS